MVDKPEEIEKLKLACFRLAKDTLWKKGPVDTDLITTHADNLFKIASDNIEVYHVLGLSVEITRRAIDYLRQVHAIPPMENDTIWFQNMLDAILSIACSNHRLEGDGRDFLKDLLYGIIESLFD